MTPAAFAAACIPPGSASPRLLGTHVSKRKYSHNKWYIKGGQANTTRTGVDLTGNNRVDIYDFAVLAQIGRCLWTSSLCTGSLKSRGVLDACNGSN